MQDHWRIILSEPMTMIVYKFVQFEKEVIYENKGSNTEKNFQVGS
jgi:hypothetical protein